MSDYLPKLDDYEDFKEFPEFQELSAFKSLIEQENNRLVISQFFEETKDKLLIKKFGDWLKILDFDTIKLLSKTGASFLFEQDDDPIKDFTDEQADYWTLCVLATAWEMESSIIPRKEFENSLESLYFLTVFEKFRRMGLTVTEGPNSLLESQITSCKITEEGRIKAEEIIKRQKNV